MPQVAVGIALSAVSTVITTQAQAKKSKKMNRLLEHQAELQRKDRELKKRVQEEKYARDRRARIAAMHRGGALRGFDVSDPTWDRKAQNIETAFEGAESILEESHGIQNQIGDVGTEIGRVQSQGPGLASSLLAGAASAAEGTFVQSGLDSGELAKYFK